MNVTKKAQFIIGDVELILVGLADYEDEAMGSRADVTPMTTPPGFITSIDVHPGDGIIATVFEWDRGSALYILEGPLRPPT